jgi:hypothetical protein
MGKNELGAALLVVCALLACKSSEQRTQERLAAVSAGAGEHRPGVPVAVASPPRTQVPALAEQLDAIRRKPADFATGKDDTGSKTVTFNLRPIQGVGLAHFVGYRGNAKAWRFGLEGAKCELLNELGLEVAELVRGDGRPLSPSWYRVKGGPLEQSLVKVFPGDGPGLCNIMPGREEYWEQQGDTPKQ